MAAQRPEAMPPDIRLTAPVLRLSMKPIIGVTCSFTGDSDDPGHGDRPRAFVNAAYTDAVFAAGGMPQPIAVPPQADIAVIDEMLVRFDGLLFTGGADLDPRHYGQAKHPKTRPMHDRRGSFEVDLFRRADVRKMPILSICLGCQIASVGRGGCLVQHVDDLTPASAVQHHRPDHGNAYHPVQVDPESTLAKITGRIAFEVNSRHHQVVDRSQMGGSLRPVAFAPDGVVEAAEDMDGRFLLAVQWHPEDLVDRPEHLALFKALVDAAEKSRRQLAATR